MVYEPQEDSYLLEKVVKESVKPRMIVCDMGTGSGIQAYAASEAGARTVLAVDIDNQALDYVMTQIKEKNYANIRTKHSDLFSEFQKTDFFDIIIFNAPYLPDDERDPDLALDGGKEGHELIGEFLKQAKDHLNENGQVLLLFSTQSNLQKVMEHITHNGFIAEEKAHEGMFFEGLYVYSLRRQGNDD